MQFGHVALFADDVRVLFVSKESDHMWSVMTIIVLVIFTVEWAGNSTFQRGYFMSMFFFLDLLAGFPVLGPESLPSSTCIADLLARVTAEAGARF